MPHTLRPLAHSPVCQIDHCAECNILHVTLGPITMRLEIGAGHHLRHTLTRALEVLEAMEAREALEAHDRGSATEPTHPDSPLVN
ncbi:MAG: hypothetical protein AAGF11_40890 [Myxococcota bacterium]